jgi:hypothetical protein
LVPFTVSRYRSCAFEELSYPADCFPRMVADAVGAVFGWLGRAGTATLRAALASLWVPNWSSTSCDLGVFVYQPVEQNAPSEVKLGWRCSRW